MSLRWDQFCAKPMEAVLPMVKEFYANLQEGVDEKVFVRGQWVDISSSTINILFGTPYHEEDDYSILMEEGVETTELVNTLCLKSKEVTWTIGKNNQHLNFHASALQPKWMPLEPHKRNSSQKERLRPRHLRRKTRKPRKKLRHRHQPKLQPRR